MSITKSNRIVAWIFAAIAILANLAGYILNLFDRVSWFDEAVHAYIAFAVTLFLSVTVYAFLLQGIRIATS